MADVLGIAVSGALASKRALTTTSHNIANSTTPGFSRQRVDITAREPEPRGNGALGTGTIVRDVSRVYNEFVVKEMRDLATTSKSLDTNFEYTSQVDNMLADPESGLAPSIQTFFAAVNGVADDPSSVSARQVLMSEANSLQDRFGYMDGRFNDLRHSLFKDMENVVTDINNISGSIAEMNEAIVRAREIGGEPNDLLDQRDRLLLQLSELVSVRSTLQDDGRLNVFIGNGQTLVIGNDASKMEVRSSLSDPSEKEIYIQSRSGSGKITRFLTGGRLGGILDFKNGVLNVTQNDLGRIAIGITKTFNDQHRLGMDLKSSLGTSFFSEIDIHAPRVTEDAENAGDLKLTAEIIDPDKLTVYDYRLSYHDGNYLLVRAQDDKLIDTFSSLPRSIDAEGFKINLTSGSAAEGDSFIISPTRYASEQFKVLTTDAARVAAASPVRISASIRNEGDGEISDIEVLRTSHELFAGDGKQLETPMVVRFIDESHFEVLNNKGEPIKRRLAAVPGAPEITANEAGEAENTGPEDKGSAPGLLSVYKYNPKTGVDVFPTPDDEDLGIRFRITGNPKAGDMFRVEFNKEGVGDNSNAVKLAGLQKKPVLVNGTANYTQVYAQLVSRVGSKTHELDTTGRAQQLLLRQATERRESISGVNMDEEAANLVKYQTMYKANAQMISTAKELFDTLIGAFR